MKWTTYQQNGYPLSEVKEDSTEYEILKQNAESGIPSAQHDMGVWHETVAHNYEEALKWYKKAGNSGYSNSQESYNNLARWLGKPEIDWE